MSMSKTRFFSAVSLFALLSQGAGGIGAAFAGAGGEDILCLESTDREAGRISSEIAEESARQVSGGLAAESVGLEALSLGLGGCAGSVFSFGPDSGAHGPAGAGYSPGLSGFVGSRGLRPLSDNFSIDGTNSDTAVTGTTIADTVTISGNGTEMTAEIDFSQGGDDIVTIESGATLSGAIKFGEGHSRVNVSGAFTGTIESTSTSSGGSTIIIFTQGTQSSAPTSLNLGAGDVSIRVVGSQGGVGSSVITIPNITGDSAERGFIICSEGFGTGRGVSCSEDANANNYGFNVALGNNTDSGNFTSFWIANEASTVRSSLKLSHNTVVTQYAKLNNMDFVSDGAAGDEISFSTPVTLQAFSATGSGATLAKAGTLFELDLNPSEENSADVIVFNSSATVASGDPTTAAVTLRAQGTGTAAEGSTVTIGKLHTDSGVTALALWDGATNSAGHAILLNNQTWTLSSGDEVDSFMPWIVTAGAETINIDNVAFANGDRSAATAGSQVTVSADWTGDFTAPTADYVDDITITAGTSVSGDWSLGGGADAIQRAAGTSGGVGTFSGLVRLGAGNDTIGFLDPNGPDGDSATTGDNPSAAQVAAARMLAMTGGVDLGDGTNTMRVSSAGSADLAAGVNAITGGAGGDTIDVAGGVMGGVDLKGGDNVFTATSLTGGYTGGADTDTITLKPDSTFDAGKISPGEGVNTLIVIGSQEDPANRQVTLDLGGAGVSGFPPLHSDTIHICNEAGTTSGCADAASGDNYAFNVVLNASGRVDPNDTNFNPWESIYIGNKDSDKRSFLQAGTDLYLATAELRNMTIKSDGTVPPKPQGAFGHRILFGGAKAFTAYTAADDTSPESGTLIELDFDPTGNRGAGASDRIEFTTSATDIIGASDTIQTATVRIVPIAGAGFAEPDTAVRIAEAKSLSGVANLGVSALTLLDSAVTTVDSVPTTTINLNNQVWTLSSTDTTVSSPGLETTTRSWTLTAGPLPFRTITITSDTLNVEAPDPAAAYNATISGSGEWTGTFTAATGDYDDTIAIAVGMTASGAWNLGNGANTITRSGTDSGDATISGLVTLGSGDDTIGFLDPDGPDGDSATTDDNPTPARISAARMLAMTGGVDLGDGTNIMHVSSAGAADLDAAVKAITGGADGDTVDVTGGVMGGVDLEGGANILTAASLAGGYTGGDGTDTINISGAAGGDIALGSSAAANTVTIGGAMGGNLQVTDGGASPAQQTISIGGGAGSATLYGVVTLTVKGDWSGAYTSYGSADTLYIDGGAEASGRLEFGAGNDTIERAANGTGPATVSGHVILGDGDDTIGGVATETEKNNINFTATVNLGEGTNEMRAASAGSASLNPGEKAITGGAGSDTVVITGGVIGGVDLKAGDNTFTAASLEGGYIGGSGSDTVNIVGNAAGDITLESDAGKLNSVTVGGEISGDIEIRGRQTQTVAIGGGSGNVSLDGNAGLTVNGDWSGTYTGGGLPDIVTLGGGIEASGSLTLSAGDDRIRRAEAGDDPATISAPVSMGDGGDTIGGDSLADGKSALVFTSSIDLGNGQNTMRAVRASASTLPAGVRRITGGDSIDNVYLSGVIEGGVDLKGGANRLEAASLTGGYSGGDSSDTIVLKPEASFASGTLAPGAGENKLFLIGSQGSPGARRATLDIGGASGPNDTLYICNEAKLADDSGCGTESGGNYAFNVALAADGASGWEAIHVSNRASAERSVLQAGASMTLATADLNNMLVESDGTAGTVVTFTGSVSFQEYAPATAGAGGSPESGALLELDIQLARGAGVTSLASDTLVFGPGVRNATGNTASPTATPSVVAKTRGSGFAEPGSAAEIARISTGNDAYVTGIQIWDASLATPAHIGDGGKIALGGQVWTLAAGAESGGYIPWTLTAGAIPADLITIDADSESQSRADSTLGSIVTITESWSGTFTAPSAADHSDSVTISPGLTASGAWTLGGGGDSIQAGSGGSPGDVGTFSALVSLGPGDDTIGGDTAAANESRLAMTGGVDLGDGANTMRVSSAGRAGLSRDAIAGGAGADTVEVSGAVMGGVDLMGGENDFTAGSLSGDYTGGDERDTVSVGAITGDVDLKGGPNTLAAASLEGSYTGGSGDDTIIITPEASFAMTALNPGGGRNRMFLIGGEGDPASRTVTLDLGGASDDQTVQDSLWICGEAASVADSRCEDTAADDRAFSVALNAAGTGGSGWESIHVSNETSGARSSLLAGTSLSLKTAKLNRMTIKSSGTAGDEITIDGPVAIQDYVPATAGQSSAPDSGTLFEIDFAPSANSGSGAADKIVFTALSKSISGSPGLTDKASVKIMPGSGNSPLDSPVMIAQLQDVSDIKSVRIWDHTLPTPRHITENETITVNSQTWTLVRGNSLAGFTDWILRAGEPPSVAVTIDTSTGGADTDISSETNPSTTGYDITITGGGTWSGDFTALDGDHDDTVTISAGMTASGVLSFGGGRNTLARAADDPGTLGEATISSQVTFGDGDDTIGGSAAAGEESKLRMAGGVALGAGANVMRVSSVGRAGLSQAIIGGGDSDTVEVSGAVMGGVNLMGGENDFMAASLSGDYTGGDDRDTVSAGAITGDVDLKGGLNTLTATSLEGSYTGGSGDDTIILTPEGSFAISALNPGGGRNRMFLIGGEGDPASRTATLDLGGALDDQTVQDSLWICGEAASAADSRCEDTAADDRAFSVVLNAAGAGGSGWESIHVSSEASDARSSLLVGTSLSLRTAKLNRLTIKSSGRAGDEITIDGPVAIQEYVPATAGQSSAPDSGTLFEIDFNPSANSGSGDADKIVFTARSKNISGSPGLTDMASVRIAPGSGVSALDSQVTIAQLHDDSDIKSVRIWDGSLQEPAHVTLGGMVTVNRQPWTLETGSSRTGFTDWILRAGEVPSVAVTVDTSTGADRDISSETNPSTTGYDITITGSGTWSGNFTALDGDHDDTVTISAGMTASGVLNFSGGRNTLARTVDDPGSLGDATISSQVVFGGGDDTIGGNTAADEESKIRMAGGVALGAGMNVVRVSSVGRAGLSQAIIGGGDSDTVEVSGAVMGGVNLMAGENSFMAQSLSGDYSGGDDKDTVEVSGAIRGNLILGGGENALTAGSLTGSYTGGDGNDDITIRVSASFKMGTLNPGSGTNRMFVVGSGESVDSRQVTLDLGGGPATGAETDSLWICSEEIDASGCTDTGLDSNAFNVALNATGENGNTWESIRVSNEDSEKRSLLRVGTDLSLKRAKLNGMTMQSNGVAGTKITFEGEIAVRDYAAATTGDGAAPESGTLFELDIDPSASGTDRGADQLVFMAFATDISNLNDLGDTAYVRLTPVNQRAATEKSEVTIMTAHEESSIKKVMILGERQVQIPDPADSANMLNVRRITLNGQDWTIEQGGVAEGVTPFTLTAGPVPFYVTWTDAFSAASGVFSQVAGETIPDQSTGARVGVAQGRFSEPSSFAWTSFKTGSEEQTLSEKRKEKYDNSFSLFTAGIGIFGLGSRNSRVTHFVSMTYGTVESDKELKSTVTGFGYGARFGLGGGAYLNASGAFATASSEKTVFGRTEEFDTEGQVLSIEGGRDFQVSHRAAMSVSGGLTASAADDLALKNGDSLTGLEKTTVDLGVKATREGSLEGGPGLFGAARLAHDMSSEFSLKESGKNAVAIDAAKTWVHVSGGLAWESSSGRLYLGGSLDQSIAGADASRQSITLGYDLSW